MKATVCVLAAGAGTRLGSPDPKALLDVGGCSMIRRACEVASAADGVEALVVAVPTEHLDRFRAALAGVPEPIVVVSGGATRQASAAAALDHVDTEAVLIHDAARVLCPTELFERVIGELGRHRAVCPVLPVTDTVKRTDGDEVIETLERSTLVAAQTPQGFHTAVYREAHVSAQADGFVGTDDASLVERLGVRVRIVAGLASNIKVTDAADLDHARAVLAS